MKLFSLPDGTVNRLERAQWLTLPFDLAAGEPSVPPAPGITIVARSDTSITLAVRADTTITIGARP